MSSISFSFSNLKIYFSYFRYCSIFFLRIFLSELLELLSLLALFLFKQHYTHMPMHIQIQIQGKHYKHNINIPAAALAFFEEEEEESLHRSPKHVVTFYSSLQKASE